MSGSLCTELSFVDSSHIQPTPTQSASSHAMWSSGDLLFQWEGGGGGVTDCRQKMETFFSDKISTSLVESGLFRTRIGRNTSASMFAFFRQAPRVDMQAPHVDVQARCADGHDK